MRGASLMLLLLVGVAVLAPAASLGQSAGDEQYVDPFQEQEDQGGSGGAGGQDTGGGQTDSGTSTSGEGGGATGEAGGTSETTPPGSTEEGGGFGASASGSSASGSDVLPRTGLPVALTALLGAVLLAGGTALRRRV